MSEKDVEIMTKVKNQILAIIVSSALIGLLINFVFITTINSSITELKEVQKIHDERINNLYINLYKK